MTLTVVEATTLSHDGVSLTYRYNRVDESKPYLTLIMPFGLRLDLAEAFFDLFADDFNIITWESRLILAPKDRAVKPHELTVDNHIADMMTILDEEKVRNSILVGVCSGAGVALAAANKEANRFSQLVLANGDYTLLDDLSCVTQHSSDIDGLFPIAAMDEQKAAFILDKINLDVNNMDSAIPLGIHLPFSNPHFFHRYALNYLSYKSLDYEQLARSIIHKTLFMSGEKDKQTNVKSTIKIKNQTNDSSLYIEEDGDHYELFRANSKALNYLKEFLSKELDYAK